MSGANGNLITLTGKIFGWLTVLRREGSLPARGSQRAKPTWRCVCTCGKEIVVRGDHLRRGSKKSCALDGHFFRQPLNEVSEAERRIWNGMLQRCYNPKNVPVYKHYGGAGVRVCREWKNNFQQFLSDMGPRPSPKHSIDRYPNPHGNYEPTNCRWATAREQALNKRATAKVFWEGRMMTVNEFAAKIGVRPPMIRRRLKAGWTVEDALTTPSGAKCKSSKHGRNEYPEDWIDGSAFKKNEELDQ